MKMQKSAIAAAVAAITGINTADAAGITSMTVTSGSFGLGYFTYNTYIPFTGIGSSNDLAAYSTYMGSNTSQPTGSGGTCVSGSISCFDFGWNQMTTFLSSEAVQTGVPGGGPTLADQSYDPAGGTTTIDMNGFFANWENIDFYQGNSSASLTTSNCVAGTCDFTASWTQFFYGGSVDGNTGCWILHGQVSGIPVPAAAWLMGSGLIGLVGVARRKKTQRR